MSHFCRQCRTEHIERTHPRFIRSERDEAIVRGAGFEVTTHGDRAVVWVPRFSCDCQWKARVRQVDSELLELLLPDPLVYAEVARRDALHRAFALTSVEI